jgi:hypothetical protein
MSIGSFLKNVGAWFAKVWKSLQDDIAPIAVTITEGLKTALDSGVLPAIASLIPDGIGAEISSWLTTNGDTVLAKILAVELGITGLPANATPAEVEAFATSVISALAGSSAAAKPQIWTTVAVQFYQLLDTAVNESANGSLSFAQIVALIEEAYQDYVADTATSTQAS